MRIFLMCLLLAACATPQRLMPTAEGGRLMAGLRIEAPAGALAYCAREAQECGGGRADGLRGSLTPVGAASNAPNRAAVFAAMMSARSQGPALLQASAPRSELNLTQARWDELRRVDRDINRQITPMTDIVQYGADEVWQRPLTHGRARGDCEDYALEKRAALIALGWPQETLALAVAVAPRIGLHAVLIAQTDHGDFVLDNFSNEPRIVDDLDYVWVSRQVGLRLTDWSTASRSLPALSPVAAPSDQEALFQRLMAERTRRSGDTPVAAQTPVALSVGTELLELPAPAKRPESKDGPRDRVVLQRLKAPLAGNLIVAAAGEGA